MAEKDITEKILENYNDVFADIVNVLLFDGENVVEEEDLFSETTNSYYKMSQKIRGQDRDVAKKWIKNTLHLAMYGIENETLYENNMPIRVIGYDGASYRNQIIRENKDNPNYPVVTIVLYFGLNHWGRNRSLMDCLDVPEKLRAYVSDYKINIFEIAYLSEKQVNMFKSDFKLIADYFVQLRKTGKYVPMQDNIKHIWETLNLLSVLTSDDSFEKTYINLKGKREVNMCGVVENFVNQGVRQGIEQGIKQGIEQGLKQAKEDSAIRMIEDGGLSPDKIAMYSGLTLEEVHKLEREYKI